LGLGGARRKEIEMPGERKVCYPGFALRDGDPTADREILCLEASK
jgi:hypothetical protein